jgi:hypothetical protein
MDYSIDYQMGGTYALLIDGVLVGSFMDYDLAQKAYDAIRIVQVPRKSFQVVRTGRTTEYDCYIDGSYVGSRRTRIEADQYLDRLVHDRLSGMAFVRGE